MGKRWFECENGTMLDMNTVLAFRVNPSAMDCNAVVAETTGAQSIIVGKLVKQDSARRVCRVLATDQSVSSWNEAVNKQS